MTWDEASMFETEILPKTTFASTMNTPQSTNKLLLCESPAT
jgi:hypothetical protein